MPSFEQSSTTAAPPEEVWKILYDPARFPEWWSGIETVEPDPATPGEPTRYTMYPDGYPDFPMPQELRTSYRERTVVISCLVSELRFEWQLRPIDDGRTTRITVRVDIPDEEADRLTGQQQVIAESLTRLTELSARAAAT